jgi:hypothetical protein
LITAWQVMMVQLVTMALLLLKMMAWQRRLKVTLLT